MTTAGGADRRRALVTGATGFVGRTLCAVLTRGTWDVHAVVRPSSDATALQAMGSRVTLHRHDGSTEGLCAIAAAAAPDIAFHLASLFRSEHKADDVGPLIDANVRFPAQLLEALRHAQVPCLVNTGSAWQHYQDRAYSPVNLYAATKQAFEALLAYSVEAHGLKAITLELFDTYGPGDTRAKLLNLARKAALQQAPLTLSPGDQLIDLVHVADVAAAFTAAADRLLDGQSTAHERYAVSSGNPLPLKELLARYERVLGVRIPVQWGGRPYRAREVMRPWSGGAPLPGWWPRIGLDEGLRSLHETPGAP